MSICLVRGSIREWKNYFKSCKFVRSGWLGFNFLNLIQLKSGLIYTDYTFLNFIFYIFTIHWTSKYRLYFQEKHFFKKMRIKHFFANKMWIKLAKTYNTHTNAYIYDFFTPDSAIPSWYPQISANRKIYIKIM